MDLENDNWEAPTGREKSESQGPGCGSRSPKEVGRSGLQGSAIMGGCIFIAKCRVSSFGATEKTTFVGENGVREGAMAKIQEREGLRHTVCNKNPQTRA